MACVLLVEDDPAIFDVLVPYVGQERWELRWARSVPEAERLLNERPPDVALVDRGLPGLSGDVLASQLAERLIPFLMLTARSEEAERLDGFDLGADDYITKPFSVPELVRRVHVVLRRRGSPRLLLGPASELDREARRVRVRGQDVQLTATELALVEQLARRPGRVYTRAELASLLGLDFDTSERTLDSHVKNVRKKLRSAGGDGDLIETVVGIGYRLRGAT